MFFLPRIVDQNHDPFKGEERLTPRQIAHG